MPASTDMIKKQIRNTIIKNDLLRKGDHVIVGLSGGPDSVCLFYVLLELKNEYELSVSAVHVNHMLRAGEAVRDQKYVEGICRDAGVMCSSVVRDCAKIAKERGVTDEEAGRDIRYEAFYDAAKELIDGGTPPEKVKIAVAQNKNDQAETVLMRVMRGSGVNGLSGIDYKRAGEYGTSVIRPLLDAGRAEIENYCTERNIRPRVDRTNEQPVYTRNKVRLELIPYIAERFNENIIDALVRLSRNAREDNEFLKDLAEAEYERVKRKAAGRPPGVNAERFAVMDRRGLAELAPAIRHRAVVAAFCEIGLTQDISAAHLSMTDNIILGKNASAEVNLPGGYVMAVSYDNASACLNIKEAAGGGAGTEREGLVVKLLTTDEYMAADGALPCGRQTQTENGTEQTRVSRVLTAAFDYGRLKESAADAPGSLELRGRQPGDYFTPRGMKTGRKKIQDYFVDRKIPKGNRDSYRLAALGSEIIWVVGPVLSGHNEVSEKYRITVGTKEVMVLEIYDET